MVLLGQLATTKGSKRALGEEIQKFKDKDGKPCFLQDLLQHSYISVPCQTFKDKDGKPCFLQDLLPYSYISVPCQTFVFNQLDAPALISLLRHEDLSIKRAAFGLVEGKYERVFKNKEMFVGAVSASLLRLGSQEERIFTYPVLCCLAKHTDFVAEMQKGSREMLEMLHVEIPDYYPKLKEFIKTALDGMPVGPKSEADGGGGGGASSGAAYAGGAFSVACGIGAGGQGRATATTVSAALGREADVQDFCINLLAKLDSASTPEILEEFRNNFTSKIDEYGSRLVVMTFAQPGFMTQLLAKAAVVKFDILDIIYAKARSESALLQSFTAAIQKIPLDAPVHAALQGSCCECKNLFQDPSLERSEAVKRTVAGAFAAVEGIGDADLPPKKRVRQEPSAN